jgi:hypothetical protein
MIEPIQPVVVAIDVRRGVQEAFRVFTEEIADWWPVAAHSVEPDRVAAVVLEGRPGGRVYERWQDGGQADWGRVVAWEPPNRLVLSWSPDPERPAATEVEVRFTAVEPGHTRVELEHRGWERLGDQAAQVRSSYEGGWPGVLDAFAGAAMQVHHRAFARSLNGLVWRLLARTDRTADEDARMVDAAHASQFHWREAGGPPATRGEWLVSHVYAVLERPERPSATPAAASTWPTATLARPTSTTPTPPRRWPVPWPVPASSTRPPPGTPEPPPPAQPSPTTRTA